MKKNTMTRTQVWNKAVGPLTIGVDLGDRHSHVCVLDGGGEVAWREKIPTTKKSLSELFLGAPASLVAIEVGTHSRWVEQIAKSGGHEVIVANAREVAYIYKSSSKSDQRDPESLARLARVDRQLLHPIRHRSEEAQGDLAVIRVRAALVEARTKLINSARGIAKSMGERLASCDADRFGQNLLRGCGEPLQNALSSLVEAVEHLTAQIHASDARIAAQQEKYPLTAALRQVYGVGPLLSQAFVLTIEDKERFQRSRDVGPYLGLRPRQSDSGDRQPQLRITKEGDRYLRTLLVQSAHCLLWKNAPDSDLKRFGEKLAARGGKNARKRAVVAVARKLAVLLHRLWVTGEVYEPLYNASRQSPAPVK